MRILFLISLLIIPRTLHAKPVGPNVALKEGVQGQFSDLKKITDGIIDKKDFSVPQPGKQDRVYLTVSFRGPVFIDRIVVYGNDALKTSEAVLKTSLDIFTWKETAEPSFAAHAKGITAATVTMSARMAQYIQFSVPKTEGTGSLHLMEIEAYKKEIAEVTFSDVRIENITEHTADVCWKSNIATTSKVKYNNNPEHLDKMVSQINLTEEHRVTLTGLLKGTDYYYQVYVDDIRPEPYMSDVLSLKTAGIPLPLFRGMSLEAGTTWAVLGWNTNVGTKAMLELGDSTGLKMKYPLKDDVLTSRKVRIDGLDPFTTYTYKFTNVDTFKHGITSGQKTFRTQEWNVALRKPVEGTFTIRPDRYITVDPPIINRINDGSTNYFRGMATSGDVTRAVQEVIVDLEKEYAVDRISIMWRRNAYSRAYALFGSLNKADWTPINKKVDAMDDGQASSSESGDPTLVVKTPANGAKMRYVRLYVGRGSAFHNKHAGRQNFVQVMEMKVFPVVERIFEPVVREIFE